jgi:Sugar phosphate permease
MENINKKDYGLMISIIFFLNWGFIFLDRLTVSLTSEVLMKTLSLSPLQFSSLTAISTLAFAISSIVMGIVSDRTGWRKRILVPFTIAAGVISFSCSFTSSYTTLLILRTLVGFFQGPVMTLMIAILAQRSSKGTFGRNAGIVAAGVAVIANTLGPILITQTITAFDLFTVFKITGLLQIVIGIVVAMSIKEVEVSKTDNNKQVKSSMGQLFKNKNFVLCTIIGIFCMTGYWTTMIFAPMYLTNIMGMSTTQRGITSSVMGLIFIPLSLSVPFISDKIGRKPIMFVAYIACALSPLGMWIFAGTFISVVIYCIFGGFPASTQPLFANIIPMESLPDHLKTSAAGTIQGLAELFGGALWPLIAGGIAEYFGGIPSIMLIATVLLLACVLLSSMLIESNTRIAAKNK